MDSRRCIVDSLKSDNDNAFIYRRPPEVKEDPNEDIKDLSYSEAKRNKRKEANIDKYIKRNQRYCANTTVIGGKVNYSSYFGGSMVSAKEGINRNASVSEAGGDLKRYRAKFCPKNDEDQNDPNKVLDKKYKRFKDKEERMMHQRRKKAWDGY